MGGGRGGREGEVGQGEGTQQKEEKEKNEEVRGVGTYQPLPPESRPLHYN